MKPRKLIYHIFPANILVTIGAVCALIWYGSWTIENFYMDETRGSLLARAYSIEEQVQSLHSHGKLDELRQFIHRVAQKTQSRITVIHVDGVVLADSIKEPETMDNHRGRPEIQAALKARTGFSMRFSSTIGEMMLYVAIPLPLHPGSDTRQMNGDVLRLSVSVASLEATLTKVKTEIAFGILFVVIIAGLVTMFVSRRITTPLEEMTKGAQRFAKGQFSPHLIPPDHVSSEIATLSQALNSMADQLQERISTILRQRNELQIFLDSMQAAVLTVDLEGRLISFNAAASTSLQIKKSTGSGCLIQDTIRNIDILQMIEKAINGDQPLEDEICIRVNGCKHFLLTNCVQLFDEDKQCFGVLLVLHDVTKLRRLENMRKDFVANVSHELKTPITSIRGYVETVLDDELADQENSIRFLQTALKKTNHLNAVIDDLLVLSRIEQQEESGEIALSPNRLKPILEEVVHTCLSKAADKKIILRLTCPDKLIIDLHKVLLEQTVLNLVINAIKYSHEGGEVLITADSTKLEDAGKVVITIRDFGVGIGKEHLPRLFERFYRSDKARSRNLGGTGLGLAIVKHIVNAHQGKVEILSKIGSGTTVIISLPAMQG